jgi:hypothetical protein
LPDENSEEMRKIFANYDEEGIYVYQAFEPSIVAAALAHGTFSKGFNLARMTWIKPSFGWMLYRSGYALKHNQEAILKIKLSHAGFLEILRQSVETSFNRRVYESDHAWSRALANSDVRHQWDPERGLNGVKFERRAIQIGIRGETVINYVNRWILQLEEVTALAREIGEAVKGRKRILPEVPRETEYVVDDELKHSLGVSPTDDIEETLSDEE